MIGEWLTALSNQWIAVKIWLHQTLGVHDDALHVHLSLLLLFTVALIIRKRPDSLWCWFIVFAAEMINEYADLRGEAAGEGTLLAAWEDLYTTMFWPTVILLFGRLLFPPRLLEQTEEQHSGDLTDETFEQPPSV